jgi:hypothetical protein
VAVECRFDLPEPVFAKLDDMSQSGFAEFARQWILLSRRKDYLDGSGLHELWMRSGGSAGHSSLWGIDVDEGSSKAGIAGERWEVTARTVNQIKQEKESEKSEEQKDKINPVVSRVVDYLEKNPGGDTKTGIREALKLNNSNTTNAINMALAKELIMAGQVVKGNKSFDGFMIAQTADQPDLDHPDNPDT